MLTANELPNTKKQNYLHNYFFFKMYILFFINNYHRND